MQAPIITSIISGAVFGSGVVLPFVVSRLSRRDWNFTQIKPLPSRPSLEVIIPAYLESGEIAGTVAALRGQLTSWPGPWSITVVASDEATASAAASADKVLSIGRSGKPAACNTGVADSRSDVVLLMDANCRVSPNEWPERLAEHLTNWSLVSANKSEKNGKEGLFWQLEASIKRSSSNQLGSLAVVGEFVAFRREDYRMIPSHIVLDDLWLAFSFHQAGLPVTVAPDIATVEQAASPRNQWERRVRINAALMTESVPKVPWLLRTPEGRVYVAHKIYRATIGVCAFWVCIIGLSLIFPPITLAIVGGVIILAVGQVAGFLSIRLPLSPLFSVLGLQAVPLAGAARALCRKLRGPKGRSNNGWTKIAR